MKMKKRDIIFLIFIVLLLVTSVYCIAHSVANYKAGELYREWQKDYMINAEIARAEAEKAKQQSSEEATPTPTSMQENTSTEGE